MDGGVQREMTVKEVCDKMRKEIKGIELEARALMDNSEFKNEQIARNQHSEMKANIMLTVRCLEDARMRVGKILQWADGGLSIYDK